MKLFSVAIGEKYEKEAERLKRSAPLPVEVFTTHDKKYRRVSKNSLIDGLWHKANFANYIDEVNSPIVFMDADMFTLKKDPFSGFSIPDNIDIAYVPYVGRWWLPDEIRQNAFNHHGHKINSGFMWFKNLEIAKTICSEWAFELLKRPQQWIKNEYDEWALMIALTKLEPRVHLLEKKWNHWELETEEEIRNSDSVFFQSHDFLNIV